MFHNGTERKYRQERQGANNENGTKHKQGKENPGHRESAAAQSNLLLLRQAAGEGQYRDDHEKTAQKHGNTECRVIPVSIGTEPGEGAAVIAHGR